MTKIAVVGRGTAGCMSAAYFTKWSGVEVDWYFDPDIKPQAVGEGANLTLPTRLQECVNFSPRDFDKVDGTIKTGIYKQGWGKTKTPFLHDFPSPATSIHFNALKLQDYVEDRISKNVNIKRMNVDVSNLDADFILDCSGKPKDYEDYKLSSYIPVNSVYVTQCYWEFPRFNHTLTIARPYGWVFGIPLQNRCSIGYMYNKDINTLEEVQEDVKHIFEQYNLVPSKDTNAFSFKNYKRRENLKGNIAYNGNSSFFLEPLEATSFGNVDAINVQAGHHWFSGHPKDLTERRYNAVIDATENIIMLHYYAGSEFVSDFWEYAEERGRRCIESADPSLSYMINNSKKPSGLGSYKDSFKNPDVTSIEMEGLYYSWWEGSFAQNVEGLGIKSKDF